jgi:hypothetical protein
MVSVRASIVFFVKYERNSEIQKEKKGKEPVKRQW